MTVDLSKIKDFPSVRSLRRRVVYLPILLFFLAPFISGCGDTIQIPEQDSTPPVTTLDIYGVLLNPHRPDQGTEDLTGFTSSCCDITRTVRLDRKIDLIASAKDEESGVRQITITAQVTVICAYYSSKPGHYKEYTLAQQPQTPASGSTAPTLLIAQGSLDLLYYWNYYCSRALEIPIAINVSIFAEAENFRNGSNKTKIVTLVYP